MPKTTNAQGDLGSIARRCPEPKGSRVTRSLGTRQPSAVVGNRGSATVAADAKSYDITGLTAIGQEFTDNRGCLSTRSVLVLRPGAVTHTLSSGKST